MNSDFTCAQCRDNLPGYVAGTLARTVRPLVERHLAVCDACQREHAHWRALADLAHQADAQTPQASAQSTASTWAAIQARILAESPITTGVHSVNNSRHDPFSTQGTAPAASPLHTPTRPSLAHRRIPLGATATVAALLLVALAVGLFAYHSRSGGSTAVFPPGNGVVDIVYNASYALSPTDVWAVGYGSTNSTSTDVSGVISRPVSGVISHFDGKRWQIDKSALFADTRLYAISMDSATDGWAVGFSATNKESGGVREVPFLSHYTQGHWVSQTLNLPGGFLFQVQMLGPDAGWAVGNDANGPLFLHFQQGAWTRTTFAPTQATPTQATPTQTASASVVSPLAYHAPLSPVAGNPEVSVSKAQFLTDTEGWAIGGDKTGLDVWQYHNGQWQTALHVPAAPDDFYFLGLGANSSTDVWVLGGAGVGTAFSSAKLAFHPLSIPSNAGPLVLLHFDGHTWALVPSDSTASGPYLGGTTWPDSSASGPFLDGATWLPKYGVVNQKQMVLGLLLNQGGHWSATTFPKPVNSVLSANRMPDGSTLVVAAMGELSESQSVSQTLQLLRYANGKWSNV